MYIKNANVVIITDYISFHIWSRTAGPYRIATELRKHGYTCQVIDCFTEFSTKQQYDILTDIVGPDTLFVGLSSTFFALIGNDQPDKRFYESAAHFQRPAVRDFASGTHNYPYFPNKMAGYFDYIKYLNPNTKIVLAGAKAEEHNAPYADVIMTGFADNAVIQYAKWCEKKNPFFQYDINEYGQMVVDGSAYNTKFDFANSTIRYEQHDNIQKNETLVMEVARGCIFSCKFCSSALYGKKKNDHVKKISVLRDEFIRNYEEFGVTNYFYSDDTHNDSTEKLRELADVVQSLPFKIQYGAYIRIDLLRAHPEQYQLLKDGGLKGAFFGIETFNHESAKIIGKGLHPEKVIEELHIFKDKFPYVGTEAGFIVGLPKETKESVHKWSNMILEEDFPLDAAIMAPLSIASNPNKIYKSIFEQDSDKWYTRTTNNTWHNGNFDEQWAQQYALHWHDKQMKMDRRRVAGWMHMALISLGLLDYTGYPALKLQSDLGMDYVDMKNKQRQQFVEYFFDQR